MNSIALDDSRAKVGDLGCRTVVFMYAEAGERGGRRVFIYVHNSGNVTFGIYVA